MQFKIKIISSEFKKKKYFGVMYTMCSSIIKQRSNIFKKKKKKKKSIVLVSIKISSENTERFSLRELLSIDSVSGTRLLVFVP